MTWLAALSRRVRMLRRRSDLQRELEVEMRLRMEFRAVEIVHDPDRRWPDAVTLGLSCVAILGLALAASAVPAARAIRVHPASVLRQD